MGPISNPINENLEALQVPHPWEPHDLSRSGAFFPCCTKVLCGRPNFFCSGLCLRFSFCLDSSLYILGVDFQQKQNQQKKLGTPRLSPLLALAFGSESKSRMHRNHWRKVKTPKETMQKGRPYHLKGDPQGADLSRKKTTKCLPSNQRWWVHPVK